MKHIKSILKEACVYTVIITFLFAFVGLFTLEKNASIPLGQFLIIMLFGLLISLAQCILKLDKLKLTYRYLIHFLVLYTSFMCTFYLTGKVTAKGASGFLICTVIFILCYFFILFLRYLTTTVYKKFK